MRERKILVKEKIVLLGSGQHANVVLYNIESQGLFEVACILSPDYHKGKREFNGIPILGGDECREEVRKKFKINKFFLGFGDMKYRKKVFDTYINDGWESVNIIHPNAVVSKDARLGTGILIEAGCLVTPNPIIGNNVVINTGSQVNHDNIIKDHVYIASGVILSGGVTIMENTLIDDGVIVTLGVKVPHDSIIGAGAVVTKNFILPGKYVGIPAKLLQGA